MSSSAGEHFKPQSTNYARTRPRKSYQSGDFEALELVAAPLTRQGRVRDAVILSKLLLTAAATAYGARGAAVDCRRRQPCRLRVAAALQGSSDPELAPLVTEARSLPESLVAAARVTDDHDILSTTLSVVGQYSVANSEVQSVT